MPRAYAKKPGAYRARITVPMTEQALERLRRFALERSRPATSVAREMLELGMIQLERASE